MASNTTSNLSLRSILEKDKLNGTNFHDWYRNLRIVLKQERKEYILDQPIPDEPSANAHRAQKDAHSKHLNNSIDVTCLMHGYMDSNLQKQLMEMDTYTIISFRQRLENDINSQFLFNLQTKFVQVFKITLHLENMRTDRTVCSQLAGE